MCGSLHRLETIEPITVPKVATESVSDETDMAEGGECSPVDSDTIGFSCGTHVFDPESIMRTASTSDRLVFNQTRYQLHAEGRSLFMDLVGSQRYNGSRK